MGRTGLFRIFKAELGTKFLAGEVRIDGGFGVCEQVR